jgi:hypothetical protein
MSLPNFGVPLDRNTIDSTLAYFARNYNTLFFQMAQFTKIMDAIADADLISLAAPTGKTAYVQADVNALRAAYRDLNKVGLVAAGSMYVTAGATLNTGVPAADDGTHFGYPFLLNSLTACAVGY